MSDKEALNEIRTVVEAPISDEETIENIESILKEYEVEVTK